VNQLFRNLTGKLSFVDIDVTRLSKISIQFRNPSHLAAPELS
jgi:hypothetical protein